jgi:minor extracellular serine protease Vpr
MQSAVRKLARSAALALLIVPAMGRADTAVNAATQADKAFAKYGLTGQGVIVAILDRGIDYTHADFRNKDGTTRIRHMWDQSAQNLCASNNPPPVEYTQTAINAALAGGAPLAERDAVGHGTVTTGLAAGNGTAAPPGSTQWAGLAPQADLVIVKVTSEGAPAHGTQPAEAAFQGCYNQALDLASGVAASLHEPIVALIDSGTQWGPIDGTSAVSARIDQDFGLNNPGYVYVAASGDEGTLPNHGRTNYGAKAASFGISIPSGGDAYMQAWYTGAVPADVTVAMADGASLTVGPGSSGSNAGITAYNYSPGQQFYPWTSSGPDRAVWILISGHSGAGTISFARTSGGSGTVDLYGDAGGVVSLTNHLTPGRLTDTSATYSATVAGAYNVRTSWKDVTGQKQSLTDEGKTGALWTFSSGGPTRDGRAPPDGGVTVATPGGNSFAAYGINSYWDTFTFNLAYKGRSLYGRHSATSAAAPILVGAAALMLQADPALTASQVRSILQETATSDSQTGATPNDNWGSGKLNVLGALDAVAAMIPAVPSASPPSLSFGTVAVGSASAPQTVTLSNSGSAPLTVTSVSVSSGFAVTTNRCGTSLTAGAHCTIKILFKPKEAGAAAGALTVKDVNGASPQTVSLSGTGG